MAEKREITSDDVRLDLLRRLRRIEGQVQGVQRMVEEGRDCSDILAQLSSIRSAVYGACLVLIKRYAEECLRRPDAEQTPQASLEKMVNLLLQMPH